MQERLLGTTFAVYSNVLKGKGANELWTFSVALKEISHFAHYCNLGSILLCHSHGTKLTFQKSNVIKVEGKLQAINFCDKLINS